MLAIIGHVGVAVWAVATEVAAARMLLEVAPRPHRIARCRVHVPIRALARIIRVCGRKIECIIRALTRSTCRFHGAPQHHEGAGQHHEQHRSLSQICRVLAQPASTRRELQLPLVKDRPEWKRKP